MARKIKFDPGRDKKRRAALNAHESNHEARALKNKEANDTDYSTHTVTLQCASVGLPVVPVAQARTVFSPTRTLPRSLERSS
jgi:hypothetical protein